MPIFNQWRHPMPIVRFGSNVDLEKSHVTVCANLNDMKYVNMKVGLKERKKIHKKNYAIFMRRNESDEPNVNRNHLDQNLMR